MTADSWFTPGRPTHPDFAVMADALLAADAASAEGDFEGYVARYSALPPTQLRQVALDEASTLYDTNSSVPINALLEASWSIGFAAGVRASRGEPPPSESDMKRNPEGTAYAGVDPNSVRYVARQRALRMASIPTETTTQKKIALAGAWFDGVMVGVRFDERRESLFP